MAKATQPKPARDPMPNLDWPAPPIADTNNLAPRPTGDAIQRAVNSAQELENLLNTPAPDKEEPIVSPETPRPARQGDDGRPYCPDHLCLLRATGTRESVTNYACPVPNCDCKEKRARPQIKIPAQPTQCPSRICDHPPQFLRIVPGKSNLAYAHMECPHCKFSVKQPRPQYSPAAENARRRAALDDFAGR